MRWLILIALLCCPTFADLPAEGGYAMVQLRQPTADLTDFTHPIDLSEMPAAWWSAIDTADATKGRAAKSDGTQIAIDWLSFDTGTSTGTARVIWPGTTASGTAQYVRIYYPRASMSSEAVTATYGGHNAYDSYVAGYYPFDSDANDRTANGNDGTLNGNTALTSSGKIGSAYNFDGTDDWIAVASPTNFPTGDTNRTFAIWAYLDTYSARNYIYHNITNTTTNTTFTMRLGSGTPNILVVAYYGNDGSWNTGDLAAGWHHICYTKDGTVGAIYIDGISIGTNSYLPTNTANNGVNIGGDASGSRSWDGNLDDARIESGIARPAEWIALEYSLTNSPLTGWSFSAASSGSAIRPRIFNAGFNAGFN